MDAIIYTTNTGSTAHYAKLLAQETGLPMYSLTEAKNAIPNGSEIVYLGWIAAGSVKGFANAAKRYRIEAVCAVGMGQTGTQTESVRKRRPSRQRFRCLPCKGISTSKSCTACTDSRWS